MVGQDVRVDRLLELTQLGGKGFDQCFTLASNDYPPVDLKVMTTMTN